MQLGGHFGWEDQRWLRVGMKEGVSSTKTEGPLVYDEYRHKGLSSAARPSCDRTSFHSFRYVLTWNFHYPEELLSAANQTILE